MKAITIELLYEDEHYLRMILEHTAEQIKRGGAKGNFSKNGIIVKYSINQIDISKPEREIRRELINGVMHEFVKSNI
jgi:hypothetical protein